MNFNHSYKLTDNFNDSVVLLLIIILKIITVDVRSFKLRAEILEIHEANPVARCCDLTWRSVVLWLFGVYVNFRVILLNKNEETAMVGDHDTAKDRAK